MADKEAAKEQEVKPASKPKGKAELINGMLKAIFVGGGGEQPGEVYSMPSVWPVEVAVDKDNNIIPPDGENGQYQTPLERLEGFARRRTVQPLEVGKAAYIMTKGRHPKIGREYITMAVQSKKFAKAELEKDIQEMLKAGKSVADVHAYLEEVDGYISKAYAGIPDEKPEGETATASKEETPKQGG